MRQVKRLSSIAAAIFFSMTIMLDDAVLFGQSLKTRTFAYVGTFSSPLKDVLPTQVDLPPGNCLLYTSPSPRD